MSKNDNNLMALQMKDAAIAAMCNYAQINPLEPHIVAGLLLLARQIGCVVDPVESYRTDHVEVRRLLSQIPQR